MRSIDNGKQQAALRLSVVMYCDEGIVLFSLPSKSVISMAQSPGACLSLKRITIELCLVEQRNGTGQLLKFSRAGPVSPEPTCMEYSFFSAGSAASANLQLKTASNPPSCPCLLVKRGGGMHMSLGNELACTVLMQMEESA